MVFIVACKKASSASNDSVSRIVEVAARLFADHGYHGVTTRQIAAAAELNIATVHHHVGTKYELYCRVYRNFFEQDEQFVAGVEEMFAKVDPRDREAIGRLLDRLADHFVDYVGENPVRARLNIRHWLARDPEFVQLDVDRLLRVYRKMRDLLHAARDAGTIQPKVEVGLIVRGLDWMVYSYFVAGAFSWTTWRDDPYKKKNLNAFKGVLRHYLRGMLGLG